MKRLFAAVIALATCVHPAFALTNAHCTKQIPPGGNVQVCYLPHLPASVFVYHLDNTQNTTASYFQIFDEKTLGVVPNASQIVSVPAGVAEDISLPAGLVDMYTTGILVGCSIQSTQGNAPTQRGCSFVISYQY